jgi:NAD(P)-dependent dehydrogenase (short-subunit alcohol dehydrogenase family)
VNTLAGRVAVVTGAGRGIGAGVAQQLVGTRRWPVAELAELMERHFKPAVRG